AGVEGRNFQLQLTEPPSKSQSQVKVTKAKSRIRTKISDFGSFIGFKGQFVPIQNSKSAYTPAHYTRQNNIDVFVPAVVGKPGSDVYYAGLNYK
uniref:Class 1 outer membrane protein (Fragments) n=1 Tax=Neisseria meningitidis TaxID=487 RepID=Q9R677_NEIME